MSVNDAVSAEWRGAMARLAADLSGMGAVEGADFVLPWRGPRRIDGEEPVRLDWDGTDWEVAAEVDRGARSALASTADFREARAICVREVMKRVGPRRGIPLKWLTSQRRSVTTVIGYVKGAGVDCSTLLGFDDIDFVPTSAPSHRWIVLPTADGLVLIGGMDRGEFAAYRVCPDEDTAADVLIALLSVEEPRPLPRPQAALVNAAEASGGLIREALAEGRVSGEAVPVGTPFDHIGNASGHYLYLYDTMMSRRSLPPTDLEEDRVGYLLQEPLVGLPEIEEAPPLFGQPGGALMVRLDVCIQRYVDSGVLLPFRV